MTVPLYNLTDTWTANSQDSILMTTTDAGFTGNLLRLHVQTSDALAIDKTGAALFGVNGIFGGSGPAVWIEPISRGVCIGNGMAYMFNAAASANGGANDIQLYRDTTGTMAQRVGVSPQTFRIYNTFTNTTNYERGTIDWNNTANVFTIGTEKGSGGGSARPMSLVFNSLTFGNTVNAAQLIFNYFGTDMVLLGNAVVTGQAQTTFCWSSSGVATGTVDTAMGRGAAGVIELGNTGGVTNFTSGATFSTPSNTPATLASGSTNNYNPGSTSYFQRITANAANSTLTGISIGGATNQIDGEIHTIINVAAAGTLTLSHQDAGSTAANRFLCSTGASIVLNPNQAADIIFDNTAARWLVFKRN